MIYFELWATLARVFFFLGSYKYDKFLYTYGISIEETRIHANISRNMVVWAEITVSAQLPSDAISQFHAEDMYRQWTGSDNVWGKRPKYSESKTGFDPFWQHKQGLCTEVYHSWEGSQEALYSPLSQTLPSHSWFSYCR